MMSQTVVRLLDMFRELQPPSRGIRILETGTAYMRHREEAEKHVEHRSTIAIAEWLCANDIPGIYNDFLSLDLHQAHINTCREALAEKGLEKYVRHVQGNAAEAIDRLGLCYDFVLLDSDSDPEPIFNEFLAVYGQMRSPAILVIDDCFKNNVGVHKGKLALPEAELRGHTVFMVDRHVAAIGFGSDAERLLGTYRRMLR